MTGTSRWSDVDHLVVFRNGVVRVEMTSLRLKATDQVRRVGGDDDQ